MFPDDEEIETTEDGEPEADPSTGKDPEPKPAAKPKKTKAPKSEISDLSESTGQALLENLKIFNERMTTSPVTPIPDGPTPAPDPKPADLAKPKAKRPLFRPFFFPDDE